VAGGWAVIDTRRPVLEGADLYWRISIRAITVPAVAAAARLKPFPTARSFPCECGAG
jgi:hypothetical protein